MDMATKLVTSPPEPAIGPTPPISWARDSSLTMAWILGFGMMTSSWGIGMLLSYLKEDKASICILSKAATYPLVK